MLKKKAIVTGATHGIGYEITRILVKHHWNVVPISRDTDKVFLEDPLFKRVKGIPFNFENVQKIEKLPIYADGKYDLLVNNAGMLNLVDFKDYSTAMMWNLLNVNLVAPMELTRNLIPFLNKGARIINVGSTSGIENEDFIINYAVTKAALIHFTKCLAKKYPQFRVNCISPGLVKTNLCGNAPLPQDVLDMIPQKREASAYEIAKVIFNLTKSEFDYMTGTNIIIDGGKSL